MTAPLLPQPLDRLPDDRSAGAAPAGAWQPAPLPGGDRSASPHAAPWPRRSPQSASSTRPPGGEHAGRLPGPDGPDPLASGSQPPGHVHALDLPATPASVAAARRAVRALLTGWGTDEEVRDNAVLVTSELVTNAVTHSASERIACRLHSTAGRLRIEVEDQNRAAALPAPRRPDPNDQSGRGLLLVEALSRDWGVTGTPRSARVVWAELATTTGAAPSPAPRPDRPTPHPDEGRPPAHGPMFTQP
ncbi:ATP-binding protein [Streptomyces sp. NPDC001508]|uniref:ATP-binding protein n=1 Tax=Streptomyces sp. NPDC001508 TaxID=3154656 RepID=UPI003323B423